MNEAEYKVGDIVTRDTWAPFPWYVALWRFVRNRRPFRGRWIPMQYRCIGTGSTFDQYGEWMGTTPLLTDLDSEMHIEGDAWHVVRCEPTYGGSPPTAPGDHHGP